MADHDPDRVRHLEDRLAAVETRLAALERTARPAPAPQPAPQPTPQLPPLPAYPAAGKPAPAPAGPSLWAQPPATASPFKRPSLGELEERLSGRLLAWVGGIALIVGAVFFLSLAFSRGWIGPEARVLIGLVAAIVALASGAWLFERRLGTPALVLVAVGVSVGMLALYAATREYGFVPPELALTGAFLIAVSAAVIALRANSPAVAALGLLAVLAGPPVFGSTPNYVTILFLGAALTGGTVIALNRSWSWLPGLGFLLAAPQVASWVWAEPSVGLAAAAVAAFWLLNALGASGDSLFRERARLHLGSTALLVANTLFAIAAIEQVLRDSGPLARVVAFVALAIGHGALAAGPLLRSRGQHPLGVLAAGTGVATLGIAVALEFGGIYQPIAWTALGFALAWLALRFDHREAGAGAAVFGALAVGHIVAVDYPLQSLPLELTPPTSEIPFTSPAAVALAVLVVSVLGVAALAWRRLVEPAVVGGVVFNRAFAVAAGALAVAALIAYAAPFELPVQGVILLWSLLAVALFGLAFRVDGGSPAALRLEVGGGILLGLGLLAALRLVAHPERLAVDPFRTTAIVPLLNEASLVLGALVVALIVEARLTGQRGWRPAAAAAAGAILLYLGSIALVDTFQARAAAGAAGDEVATQAQVALSISWVVVGALAFGFGLLRRVAAARFMGLGLLTLATAKVFLFDLAALDVAYRVLSLIGLGLVLLASSFVAVRFRPSPRPTDDPGRA